MASEAMPTTQGTRVLLRVRPLNSREHEERGGTARCLELLSNHCSACYVGQEAPLSNVFCFDRVLGEDASQESVFEVL